MMLWQSLVYKRHNDPKEWFRVNWGQGTERGLNSTERQSLNWICGNPELCEIQRENCDQDHLDSPEEKVGIFFLSLFL